MRQAVVNDIATDRVVVSQNPRLQQWARLRTTHRGSMRGVGVLMSDEVGLVEGGDVTWHVTACRYCPCPCLAHVGNHTGGGRRH
jgi:hypothetical protein